MKPFIFAFLDDLYILTSKARAAAAFEAVAVHVEQHADVQSHTGKFEAWKRSGDEAPPDLAAVSGEAWMADKPDSENGIVILAISLGIPAASAHATK